MGRAAYYAGEHDRKIAWVCRKLIQRGDTVLDIGANLGMVSVHMASLVGDGGVVHAFEPNPRLIGLLRRALDRNCLPQVKLHEFGLGPAESTLELRVPGRDTGEGSFVWNKDTEDCLSVQVRVRTLDDVAGEQDIRSVSFVKINMEGFEASVFRGATQFLGQVRPKAILFELMEGISGRVSDAPVFRTLIECGYAFLSIPRSMVKMRLRPFNPSESRCQLSAMIFVQLFQARLLGSDEYCAVVDSYIEESISIYSRTSGGTVGSAIRIPKKFGTRG